MLAALAEEVARLVRVRFFPNVVTQPVLDAIARQLRRELAELRTLVEDTMAASQADIDALTSKLDGLKTKLDDSESRIRAEIAKLSGQGVDVSALSAAVDSLSLEVDEAAALVPASPAAEPGPVVDPSTGEAVDETGTSPA